MPLIPSKNHLRQVLMVMDAPLSYDLLYIMKLHFISISRDHLITKMMYQIANGFKLDVFVQVKDFLVRLVEWKRASMKARFCK